MEEQIKELAEQMELLIEKVDRMEDIVTSLQEKVNKQRTEQNDLKQSKSNPQSFWNSWNKFKDALYHGDVENKEQHYQTYINRVKELYRDPSKALQEMEQQYLKATNKSNQSNSPFVVKDDWKVYFQIEELGHKGSLGIALQEINNHLHINIPKEQTEQAKQYYFHCLKKAYQGSYTEDQLKGMFNKFVADFPID